MKRALLIIAAAAVVFGILCLLISAFHWYSFYHVFDGSAALYERLERRKNIFLAAGIILSAAGAVLFKIRSRI